MEAVSNDATLSTCTAYALSSKTRQHMYIVVESISEGLARKLPRYVHRGNPKEIAPVDTTVQIYIHVNLKIRGS